MVGIGEGGENLYRCRPHILAVRGSLKKGSMCGTDSRARKNLVSICRAHGGSAVGCEPGFSPCHHLCEERILASPQLSGLGLGGPRKGHPAVGLWYNVLKVHLPPKQIF